MELPVTENRKERFFKEALKVLVALAMLGGLLYFLFTQFKNADHPPQGSPPAAVIKTKDSGINIYIYQWSRSGITYLVFKYDNSISVINFTADSLRLVNYNDFQASIADSIEK